MLQRLLTAIYMLTIVARAFFPKGEYDIRVNTGISDPGVRMLIPLYIFAIAMTLLGINSTYLINFLMSIVGGIA